MKLLAMGLFLVAATGCTTPDYVRISKQVGDYGLQKYDNQDVRCYIYRDDDGNSMQCFEKSSKDMPTPVVTETKEEK